MQVKTPEINSMIEALSQHYRQNISNRFTRSALSSLPLDSTSWSQIEELTEKTENYKYQGYHLDELYVLIIAISRFVSIAHKQAAQALRYSKSDSLNPQDRILRDMVVNNFGSNLNILADMINKLYIELVKIDKESAAGRVPVCNKYPELNELGHYLIG